MAAATKSSCRKAVPAPKHSRLRGRRRRTRGAGPPRGDERPDLDPRTGSRPSRRSRSFVREGVDRPAADPRPADASPPAIWPAEEAQPLLEEPARLRPASCRPGTRTARDRARRDPAGRRPGGDSLPADQAKAFRKELGELGVRVIRIGTRARPDAVRPGPHRGRRPASRSRSSSRTTTSCPTTSS